jgi:hypothetical protein
MGQLVQPASRSHFRLQGLKPGVFKLMGQLDHSLTVVARDGGCENVGRKVVADVERFGAET